MIVGSAAHLAIENKVKHGDDLIVTADAYIQENLLDKFDAKLLDPKAFNEKREAMLECLRNWEQQFYPWMMENIQDPDKQVEVKLQTEFRGTLFTGVVDVVLDSGVFADWKGLSLDTPIPTKSGWTTMGDIKPGDQVFDRHGKLCTVVGKSTVHNKRCYKVSFDDGTHIICDHDHLWVTTTGYRNKVEAVVDTETMSRTVRNKITRQRDHRIDVAYPLDLPYVDLPIEPYTLGCWLGDGASRGDCLTGNDEEIFQNIMRSGFKVMPPQAKTNRETTSCETRTIVGLRPLLKETGLTYNKHVPSAYLRSSIMQRLSLLQGMMDTDGTYNKIRNQAIFTSTNKQLAYSVQELANSLGMRARVFELTKRGFGKIITAWDVVFTPNEYNPFRISRKAKLVRGPTSKSKRRLVTSVVEVDSVPTQCISVDSPDHTYLCGEQMVPTHNTGKVPTMDTLAKDAQSIVYYWLAKQNGLPPPPKFIYVYLIGQPTNYKMEEYKSGPRKGELHPVLDKDNPKNKYSFPVEVTDDKVDSLLNNYLGPLTEAYKRRIYYKNPSDYNCKSCIYRTACKDTDLPSREDYDLPRVLT